MAVFNRSLPIQIFSRGRGGFPAAIFAALLMLGATPRGVFAQTEMAAQKPSTLPPVVEAPAEENFRYDNSWEMSAGLAFAALPSGPNIPMRAELPGAYLSATQWIYPRLGATADLRFYAGDANTNANPYNVNSPLFVEPFLSIGPEYRLVRTSAIGVSVHALAGGGAGVFNFHVPPMVSFNQLGNYSNSGTWDLIGGANVDFNRPSGFAVRVSPNVMTTDFNGDLRASFSLTAGFVFRFGKF
jgi:hypothetical protein